MDRIKADTVMHDISDAIAGVLETHGLTREKTRGKYDAAELTVTITLAEAAADGEVVNKDTREAKAFVRYAPGLGLDPDLLGRRVKVGGTPLVVAGLNTRATKNVILYVADDGRRFHGTAEALKVAKVML